MAQHKALVVLAAAALCAGVTAAGQGLARTQPQSSRPVPVGDYDQVIQNGRAQLQAGTADLALASGENAIKLNASRWEAYALAGGALMKLKRYEDAADNFSRAIDRAPEEKRGTLRELRRQCLTAESVAPAKQENLAAGTQGSARLIQPPAGNPTQSEIVLWKSIENSTRVEDFRAYLQAYPQGTFSSIAAARIARLESEAAVAKVKETELKSKREKEEAKEAELQKYTLPVAHLHARLTFSGNPGCYGHIRIYPDAAVYDGEEGRMTFAKADITYIDIAKTGMANFLRLHTANGAWSFVPIDEADVQNHKFKGAYPPGKLGNLIAERWGFVATDNGKRLGPPTP